MVTLKPALYVTLTARDAQTGKPLKEFSMKTVFPIPATIW